VIQTEDRCAKSSFAELRAFTVRGGGAVFPHETRVVGTGIGGVTGLRYMTEFRRWARSLIWVQMMPYARCHINLAVPCTLLRELCEQYATEETPLRRVEGCHRSTAREDSYQRRRTTLPPPPPPPVRPQRELEGRIVDYKRQTLTEDAPSRNANDLPMLRCLLRPPHLLRPVHQPLRPIPVYFLPGSTCSTASRPGGWRRRWRTPV